MAMPFDTPCYFGDDENFPYDVEEEFWGFTEHLDDYKPGGLHPIQLNDRLGENGRFRVVHKLGYGGYGTVWLCQDTFSPTTLWRAVKVMSANESTPDCAELRAIETLRDIDHSTLQNDFHISIPLEHFWIDGPNGRHLALVFTLSACNVDDFSCDYMPYRTLIKDLCFQLAKSLELLHSRSLCHGDFRSSNILLRLLPGVDTLPESELLKALHSEKAQIVRVKSREDRQLVSRSAHPSVPEHLVSSVAIDFHSSLCAAALSVTDFGVSYPFNDPPVEGCTGIPLVYKSPEERLRQRHLLGPASDIWALGCVILELGFNHHQFANPDPELGDDDDTIAAMFEETLGPMPEPYRHAYKEEHKKTEKWRCFDEKVAEDDVPDEDGNMKHLTLPALPWRKRTLAEHAERMNTGECTLTLGMETLKRRLQRTMGLCITKQERDGMMKQYESSRRLLAEGKEAGMVPLPYDEETKNGKRWDVDDENNIDLKLDEEETEQAFDLMKSIFKWRPEDRVTIKEVLEHPWFEGRNRDAKKVPTPVLAGSLGERTWRM